jgi:pilus assembly protein CpaF
MRERFLVRVRRPDGEHTEHDVYTADSLLVGRDDGCDVVLPSPAVSRFHLEIERAADGLRVTDQSSNGTLAGDLRVHGSSAIVPPHATLQVGPYALHVAPRRSGDGHDDASPELRRRIHRVLLDHLDLASLDAANMKESVLRPRVVSALKAIVAIHEREIPEPRARERLVVEMTDEVLGLGPLQELLDDDDVSEVMVVDPETIYVEKHGTIELTSLRFMDDESCRAVIERIVTPLGRRIDESTPLVDARLQDGSRVNAVIPPLAIRGPCITIRKFERRPLRMSDLVSLGALSSAMAAFLKRCVRAKKNVIISGGTGSGKTTLLNVLSSAIPSQERIVTIEDAAELRLDQPHVVSLESRPSNLEGSGEYTIRDLLRNALRMRPDRILVGECRAGEAVDMLQAMNTGHEGSMTTTHANSVREAMKRIETLCMMSGLDLSPKSVREQIASSVHVVVQQTRMSDGTRRVTSIAEVDAVDEDGELVLHDIFCFHRTGTGAAGEVVGEHRSTGYVPSFLDDFIARDLVEGGQYL